MKNLKNTAAIFLLVVPLVGCGNTTKAYIATSESFTSSVEALTELRQAGVIDNDNDWKRIKKTAIAADKGLDAWGVALDKGEKYPSYKAVMELVRDLARTYAELLEKD